MAPIRRIAAALAATLLLVPGDAGAEGEGRRFSIHPSVRVVGVYDDNLFFDDEDPDSGYGAWIIPRLELAYRGRSYELGADLGADIRRYLREPALDEEFFRLRGYGEFGLLPGLTLRLSDTYAPQPLQLGLPEDDADNLVQTNRVDAELGYWRELSGGRELELGAHGTRFMGESFAADVPTGAGLGVDEDFRPDFWEVAGFAEFKNPLGRRHSAYTRLQVRRRLFDDSPLSDHTDLSLLVGVRSRWSRNLEFALAAGWGLIAFDSQGLQERFLGEGRLEHRLRAGWSWRASLVNKFTADLAGNPFVETTGRLVLEKRFGTRTLWSAGGFLSRFENKSWDHPVNLFGGFEASVRRQMTRRAQLKLAYRYWINGGDCAFDDFRQNRIVVEFLYRR